MKSANAVLIKFAGTFIGSWISFTLFDNVFLTIIFIIAGLGTILNFFIGDLLILPRLGNAAASIADGILAAGTAYIILTIANFPGFISILVFAGVVAVFEFFFHMYLFKADIIRDKNSRSIANKKKLNFSTEIAKELNPDYSLWRSKKNNR